jgi:hypothetical protein
MDILFGYAILFKNRVNKIPYTKRDFNFLSLLVTRLFVDIRNILNFLI